MYLGLQTKRKQQTSGGKEKKWAREREIEEKEERNLERANKQQTTNICLHSDSNKHIRSGSTGCVLYAQNIIYGIGNSHKWSYLAKTHALTPHTRTRIHSSVCILWIKWIEMKHARLKLLLRDYEVCQIRLSMRVSIFLSLFLTLSFSVPCPVSIRNLSDKENEKKYRISENSFLPQTNISVSIHLDDEFIENICCYLQSSLRSAISSNTQFVYFCSHFLKKKKKRSLGISLFLVKNQSIFNVRWPHTQHSKNIDAKSPC